MARLRYNGLTATLAADLTAADTAISFAAALTHSGAAATAVPTIGSGDYIPLTLLDSAGNVREIVNLTAYTAGATTGTIARAQEGTTAVTHASGSAVANTPTVNDFTSTGGGGSTLRSVDNPADPSWGTASVYDLEFDADSSALPSGWSWVNQGTSTYEQKFGAGIITPQAGAGTDNGHRLLVRALPAETTWTLTAKIGMGAMLKDWQRVALVLRDSTTGKYTLFSQTGGATQTYPLQLNDWSALGTFFGNETAIVSGRARYMRIVRRSGPVYDFGFSDDGVGWTNLVEGKAPYSTYDQVGFLVNKPGGALTMTAAFHWFRVRTP